TPLRNQVDGDCMKVVCDGAGSSLTIDDDTDVPSSPTCRMARCESGTAAETASPQGASCVESGNGGTCSATGACMLCAGAPLDCSAGSPTEPRDDYEVGATDLGPINPAT